MQEIDKLYLVKDHSTVTNERPVLIEVSGTVDLMIYGSNKDLEDIDSVSDLTPCLLENLGQDLVSTFSGLPKYIAFIGTADYINVQDRDLTEIKPIS